jgi:hypothetical protein
MLTETAIIPQEYRKQYARIRAEWCVRCASCPAVRAQHAMRHREGGGTFCLQCTAELEAAKKARAAERKAAAEQNPSQPNLPASRDVEHGLPQGIAMGGAVTD